MKNNVKELRWAKNISVTQLSKHCHVSHSTITKIENGDVKDIMLQTAYSIADALGESVYSVFPYKKH